MAPQRQSWCLLLVGLALKPDVSAFRMYTGQWFSAEGGSTLPTPGGMWQYLEVFAVITTGSLLSA